MYGMFMFVFNGYREKHHFWGLSSIRSYVRLEPGSKGESDFELQDQFNGQSLFFCPPNELMFAVSILADLYFTSIICEVMMLL